MKIKELAYSTQQQLQASTGVSFRRTHIYELLAASFGFNSHAAFGIDTLLVRHRPGGSRSVLRDALIRRRCMELGYQPDIATSVVSILKSFLAEQQIGAVSLSSLISYLRDEWPIQDDEPGYDEEHLFGAVHEMCDPILLDGLGTAASKGNASAHYALALIHSPDDENAPNAMNSYWYLQGQQGHVLKGAEKEWAEAYESRMVNMEKCRLHLKEAGRLGCQDALLDLADRFGDPSFFEQPRCDVDADPAEVAAVAKRMGRTADVIRWLTLAAEGGDTDAMLQLIEEYDHDDLLRCWTWVYLSQLVGMDLTQDAYVAINEDGLDYDDDVGGPAYVAGRGGVRLEQLAPAQDAAARLAAQKLFEQQA
ncbi:MAG: hypothetical protein QM769_09035 [Pseudoxanthomonas sp.]